MSRRVLFSGHFEIRHPVGPREGPGVLNLGIGIRFGLAEAHRFADGVGEIVIHDDVGEIGVGAQIGQRIVPVKFVGGDIEERIGGGVGGPADGVPIIARSQKRQHEEEIGLPAPLAERLAKIRV